MRFFLYKHATIRLKQSMQTKYYENIKNLGRATFLLAILGVISTNTSAAPDMAMGKIGSERGSLYQNVSMVVPYKVAPPTPVRKPGQKIGIMTAPLPRTTTPYNIENNFNGGIAAYRAGQIRTALKLFAQTADNSKLNDFERAAGAFWAARCADKMGKTTESRQLRQIAARYPHSFYGQIAAAQLGQIPALNWERPAPSLAALNRIQSHPQGPLVLDHIAAGRLSAADASLLQMSRGADAELRLAIVAFAVHHGLPATAMRLAHVVEGDTGRRFDAAYYPVGAWMKAADFRVDRALVHAIVRQESGFNPNARSNMGAVGLMQLLPSTASYVVKVRAGGRVDTTDLTPARRNLDVGQHYMQYLLDYKGIDGDVMNMLIAYNAGPGNLMKWQKTYADTTNDPLLFIETIPSAETRNYIEKVMASYWIYRARFGQTNPTLVSLAAGQDAPLTPSSSASWFAGLKLDRLMKM